MEVLVTDYCGNESYMADSYQENEQWGFLSFAAPSRGLDVIPDLIPGLGPIGGIYSALENVDCSRVFIFPCDMPFLNTEFVKYMSQIPDIYDVIVPKAGDFFQPLHAIYSKKCLSKIKKQIDEKNFKMSAIFEDLNIRIVGEDEIGFYGDPFMMFKNINFRSDLGLN